MTKVSPQLASQTISKSALADLLYYLGRDKWEKNHNRHQLTIEPWATGIWVKEAGIISYADLAEFIRNSTLLKASGLQVEQRSSGLFLVEGKQQPWYAVSRQNGQYKCECMLYRCRRNRLEKEMPQVFEALNKKIFCHHTVAAYLSLKHQKKAQNKP